MAKSVTVEMSNDNFRRTLWLLKLRYGKRKGAVRLFQLAAQEIAAMEAQKLIDEEGYQVETGP